jgi:hypothetical protein
MNDETVTQGRRTNAMRSLPAVLNAKSVLTVLVYFLSPKKNCVLKCTPASVYIQNKRQLTMADS